MSRFGFARRNTMIRRVLSTWLLSLPLPLVAAPAAWPGSIAGRLAAEVELRSLSTELLSRDSATSTLDRWCTIHHMASNPTVIAERVPAETPSVPEDIRRVLQVSEGEPLVYRRVRLKCGTHLLSDAENWYVPSRLTPAMNTQLAATDVPFGRVIQALRFRRRTISSIPLWSPLPAHWEDRPSSEWETETAIQIPQYVLENRAVLTVSDGFPISFVIERYTGGILSFAPPRAVLKSRLEHR